MSIMGYLILYVLPIFLIIVSIDAMIWTQKQRNKKSISILNFIPLIFIMLPIIGPIVCLVMLTCVTENYFYKRVGKTKFWNKINIQIPLK